MVILSLRSSSANQYDTCPHAYYLQYVLGFRTPSNKKASLGNVVHKGLELLAGKKLCEQNKEYVFEEEGIETMIKAQKPIPFLLTDNRIVAASVNPKNAIDYAFTYYGIIDAQKDWTAKDLTLCHTWMDMALEFKGGIFNPEKRTIISPEKKFEFEIDEVWSKYDFNLKNGLQLQGKLKLHGTIDLITKIDDHTYEIIDWKTGSCVDWKTKGFPRKEYGKFTKDPQLLLYYYAARRIFPEIKNIIFTIFYVRDGGPTTLGFDDYDYLLAEKMIKKKFEAIKEDLTADLRIGDWCNFCWFKKNKYKDSGQNYCRFFKQQKERYGLDHTLIEHGKLDNLGKYGSGGGKKDG